MTAKHAPAKCFLEHARSILLAAPASTMVTLVAPLGMAATETSTRTMCQPQQTTCTVWQLPLVPSTLLSHVRKRQCTNTVASGEFDAAHQNSNNVAQDTTPS
jgi:hypothetical protein